MPFEVGQAVNKLTESALNAPGVRGIARNPVYTAVIIVLVMLLITAIIAGISLRDTARIGFWGAMATTGIVFMNNSVLSAEISAEKEGDSLQKLFEVEMPEPASIPALTPA